MSSLQFTFGVEFEFALASVADDMADPLPADKRQVRGLRRRYERWDILRVQSYEDADKEVKKSIAAKLREAGLPSATANDPAEANLNKFYPWIDGCWVVTTDSSIRPPEQDDQQHDWWKIEINSPPLIFTPQALDAVQLACRILTSSFRINVNESCGLHVHVGSGHDGFSLHTLGNLMAFLWCFEPVIDTLHPSFRVHGKWCRSMRRSSRLAHRVQHFEESNVDILRRIFAERHVESLLHQLQEVENNGTKEAYYTFNLQEMARMFRAESGKVTLEFRQHEGTLDGPRTVAWIQTVVGLLEFAADCDRFWMASFLFQHAEIEDAGSEVYRIEDLLRDIGLTAPAEFYAARPHLS